MSSSKRKLTHSDYMVAWISALPLEMAAAKAMLDDVHTTLPTTPNDNNAYCLGEIGGHNVVISCLPSGVYGHTSAAVVAQQMLSTFPAIRFGLLVGIGGGVPGGPTDIRLGDVVVSEPTPGYGGVVQYDYGKRLTEDKFHRTGTLNKPPEILLTAISSLKADHLLGKSQVMEYLNAAQEENPGSRLSFVYPGTEQDILFDASYRHENGDSSCLTCDSKRRVHRNMRPSTEPQIHYGLIGTANQVMKDAIIRDKLAKEMGILCYEMEAAGVMDHLQCLVVRGICDYSDSHKNKQWQNYAAATAAAYTKDLLRSYISELSRSGARGSITQESFHSRIPINKSRIIGREKEIDCIKETFTAEEGGQRVAVIHGFSGYGKTQLALHYLTTEKASYRSSLWVDGSSNQMAEQSFAKISSHIRGSVNDHDTVVDKVKGWLEEDKNTSWIMVIDGVPPVADMDDSNNLDIRRYLPNCDHGHILLTTTATDLHLLLGLPGVQVSGIDENAGSGLILRCARISSPREQTLVVARAISRKLGGVPLALEQAGFFLWKEQIPVSDYNEKFRELYFDETLQSPMNRYVGSYEKVRTMWAALDMSHRTLSRRSPNAARLLCLAAFLGPGIIPFSVITGPLSTSVVSSVSGPIERDENFSSTLSWLGNLYSDKRSFAAAINEIEGSGFVQFKRCATDTVIESLFVHDLVRSFIKSKASIEEGMESAAASLWLNAKELFDPSNLHQPDKLRNHMGLLFTVANTFIGIVPKNMIQESDGRYFELCGSVAPVYGRVCRLNLDFEQARYFWRIWFVYRSYTKGIEAFANRTELENLLTAADIDIKQGFLDDGIEKYEIFLQSCSENLPDEDEILATAAGSLRDARELAARSEGQVRRAAASRGYSKSLPQSDDVPQVDAGRERDLLAQYESADNMPEVDTRKEWDLLAKYEATIATFGEYHIKTRECAVRLATYYKEEGRLDREEQYREVAWRNLADSVDSIAGYTSEDLWLLYDLCTCYLMNGKLLAKLEEDLYLAPTWIPKDFPCKLSLLLLDVEGPHIVQLMGKGDITLAKALVGRHEQTTMLGWIAELPDNDIRKTLFGWVKELDNLYGLISLLSLGRGNGLLNMHLSMQSDVWKDKSMSGVLLYAAVKSNYTAAIQTLLDKWPGSSESLVLKEVLLHYAAAADNTSLVRTVLEGEDMCHGKRVLMTTALNSALIQGNVEMAKLLLDHNSRSPEGTSLCHGEFVHTGCGRWEDLDDAMEIQALLTTYLCRGPESQQRVRGTRWQDDEKSKQEPYECSAQQMFSRARHAPFRSSQDTRYTDGPCYFIEDKYLKMAIRSALRHRDEEMCTMVINRLLHLTDESGQTLLHEAMRARDEPPVVRRAIETASLLINVPDFQGWTPLHIAVDEVNVNAVRILIEKGADLTMKNRSGQTPLEHALTQLKEIDGTGLTWPKIKVASVGFGYAAQLKEFDGTGLMWPKKQGARVDSEYAARLMADIIRMLEHPIRCETVD